MVIGLQVSRNWVAKSFTNYGPNKHRSCHWVVSHLRITAFYAKQTAPKSRPPKLPHHENKRITQYHHHCHLTSRYFHRQSRNRVFLNTNKNHWLRNNFHTIESLLKASYLDWQRNGWQFF